MGKYGKWIGGGLGWVTGGPVGAIIGFFIGSLFDGVEVKKGFHIESGTPGQTQRGDFTVSLLVLASSVMKADGKVMKSELNYVRNFLTQNFGADGAQQQMLVLKELLNKPINLMEVCGQIRMYMGPAERSQLLHFLFGISKADGHVHSSEVNVIEQIAGHLGIPKPDLESIKAMFYKDADSAYKILEIDSGVSDDEVKQAYRKMAVKYHPDKVSHLGEEVQNGAKEKFQTLTDAYDTIKKERGIK